MAVYKKAFVFMIHHEDSTLAGKVQTDNDGGKVRFGLNSNAHPELLTSGFYERPVAEALVEALDHYREWYWRAVHGDMITSQAVANKIFDQSVPMGVGQVGKLVQRTLNDFTNPPVPVLQVDGIIGPKTVALLNTATSGINAQEFMKQFGFRVDKFYKALVDTHPQWAEDLPGWLARLNDQLTV